MTGRLSTLAAAFVIARRDFTAILFSRSFFFFLLGPLFPLLVGGLAGGIGKEVQSNAARPELGVAMSAADAQALIAARERLEPQLGSAVPQLVVVKDSWAVENGFLTPTLKIKRNVIESTYGAQFQGWSERTEVVLWQD